MNSLLGGGCIHSSGISLWEMQNFKLQPFRKHPFWAEMLHRKDYQVGIPPRHEVETFQSKSSRYCNTGVSFSFNVQRTSVYYFGYYRKSLTQTGSSEEHLYCVKQIFSSYISKQQGLFNRLMSNLRALTGYLLDFE